MTDKKLFLIDANALCYRSYYAIKGLVNSKGQATNAVYGFVSTLKKILRDFQPDYVAICFDVGKKTFRQEKFSDYKVQRPPMPDDLVSQLPLIKEVVEAYNLAICEKEGFEADDVIATLVEKFKQKDFEIVIVSEDKDMFQLVENKVKMFSIRQESLMGPADVKERFGVSPERVVDYIALVGDKSDNIPGVNGIGEVTARELLEEYGTLNNILNHLGKLTAKKVKEKLETQIEIARLSRELAVLDTRVPIKIELKDLKVGMPQHSRLMNIFQELEFKKFTEELFEQSEDSGLPKSEPLSRVDDIDTLKKEILKSEKFAFLIDLDPRQGQFGQGVNLALGKSKAVFIPQHDVTQLKDVFENPGITKITHDLKSALHALSFLNLEIKGEVFDVMLAGYLLTTSQMSYSLENLIWNIFKKPVPAGQIVSAIQFLIPMQEYMAKELSEKSLTKLFKEIEMPLAYVLYAMEKQGVAVDTSLLSQLSEECDAKLNQLMKTLYQMAGEEINLNSPKQLSHFLFEKLKLPVIKKTKTGNSTDEEVLMTLAQNHEAPQTILAYRQISKLKSTYIDALPKLVNAQTGRIHANFNQVGTETGRLSSHNPNLQNIPIRTEMGRQIRQAFIPSAKDNIIIAADYSQIELRILAHLSKDENLLKAFQEDQDIHRYTASLVFDTKENEVTPQMRNSAKRVNFGIIYGMSSFGLAKDLGVSKEEAQDFIDRYFLRYPGVKKFMDEQIQFCRGNGYVITLLNRRRYIAEIHSKNMGMRQFAERQAINTPVQGSAADLMKLAMIRIQEDITKNGFASRMIISVHDEFVFDVPKKEKDAVAQRVQYQMENALKLSVPVKISLKAGKNWLQTEELNSSLSHK